MVNRLTRCRCLGRVSLTCHATHALQRRTRQRGTHVIRLRRGRLLGVVLATTWLGEPLGWDLLAGGALIALSVGVAARA